MASGSPVGREIGLSHTLMDQATHNKVVSFIWDIADDFGDTNLLVVNPEQGRSLAKRLGPYSISLMRGHGFTAAGKTLIQALWMAVYLPVNAAVQSEASRLGPFKPLSKREIELGEALDPTSPAMLRSWEYWAKRAGCEALLNDD